MSASALTRGRPEEHGVHGFQGHLLLVDGVLDAQHGGHEGVGGGQPVKHTHTESASSLASL